MTEPLPGHEYQRGKISVPYLDRNGLPLSMRFRCTELDHPGQHCKDLSHGKYMGLPDEPTRMFNIRAIHQAKNEIHIAEGEFDAMILTRVGLDAVAIPGVQNWKGHHRRMLAGFSRIWIWADGDGPGADFSRRLTQAMRNARAVRVPRGMDVTDLFIQGGAGALLNLIGDTSK